MISKPRSKCLVPGFILICLMCEQAPAQPWFSAGSRPQDYDMGGDPMVSHGSPNPGFVFSKVASTNGFGTWMTTILPGKFLGKGVRLTAYVRSEDIEPYSIQTGQGYASFWMRVDGPGSQTLSFDNMATRPVTGTTDWKECEIILDVPDNCTDLNFGLLLAGTGKTWADGLQLEEAPRTWSRRNRVISEFIHSFRAIDESTVWGGANHGVFLRTTDGGMNWASGSVQGADQLTFYSIAAIDQNTAYYLGQTPAGGDGRIYLTSDGGSTWNLQHQDTRPGTFLNSIAFWDNQNGIAVGDPVDGSFVILTTTDGGANWDQVPAANIPAPVPGEYGGLTGDGGTCLTVQGTGNAWFGTGAASPLRVLRSTDKGQTWVAVNTPLSVFGITTIAFKDSLNGFAGGNTFPHNDSLITIVKTTDGGQTWGGVPMFPQIGPSTLDIVPNTNNGTLFVTSPQGSAISEDGGTTWERLSTEPCAPSTFASPTAGWAGGYDLGRILTFVPDPATSVRDAESGRPQEFRLSQNYPNPFNPSTVIRFQLPVDNHVTLKVYDLLGREVAVLVDEKKPAGTHEVTWNGSGLGSGLYFYRIEAHGKNGTSYVQTRKMLLVK